MQRPERGFRQRTSNFLRMRPALHTPAQWLGQDYRTLRIFARFPSCFPSR